MSGLKSLNLNTLKETEMNYIMKVRKTNYFNAVYADDNMIYFVRKSTST